MGKRRNKNMDSGISLTDIKLKPRNEGSKHKRFGNISDKVKQQILSELLAGTDKSVISKKFLISVNEIKRLHRYYKSEMSDKRNSEICKPVNSGSPLGLEIKSNNDFRSLANAATIITDTGINENGENEKNDVYEESQKIETKTELISDDITLEDSKKDIKKRVKGDKIQDDTIYSIITDLKVKSYSQRKIAEMYNVSQSMVSMIAHGKGRFKTILDKYQPPSSSNTTINAAMAIINNNGTVINNNKIKELNANNGVDLDDLIMVPTINYGSSNESDSLNEQAEKILSNSNILAKRRKVIKYLRVGMIRNRHPIPVDLYIYEHVPDYTVTNFQKLYTIANGKIKELLDYNENNHNYQIMVYVTGLTSVLSTVIKVCFDLKINLRLLHWNPSKGKYMPQDIFTDFGSGVSGDNLCPPQLENLTCRELFTYGCTASDFVNQKNGYEIIEFMDTPLSNSKVKDVTLFTSVDDTWDYYRAACENALDGTNIIMNKVYIDDENQLIASKTLSKKIS